MRKPLLDLADEGGLRPSFTLWIGDGSAFSQCFRPFGAPDTLSGDILRLSKQLPIRSGCFEMEGDIMRPFPHLYKFSEQYEDVSENIGAVITPVPLMLIL